MATLRPTRIVFSAFFAAFSVLVLLSLATTLLGRVGDVVARVVTGFFGCLLAYGLALECGLAALALVRGKGFPLSRAVGDVILGAALGGLLDAFGAGGLLGRVVASAATDTFADAALGFGILGVSSVLAWRVRRELAAILVAAYTHTVGVLDPPTRSVPLPRAMSMQSSPGRAPRLSLASSTVSPGTAPRVLRPINRSCRYGLPPASLLAAASPCSEAEVATDEEATLLAGTLASYDVEASVDGVFVGPTVVTYEVTLARGTRFAKAAGLAGDISLAFGRKVRVASGSTGRLAFEVAREHRAHVGLRELVESGSLEDAVLPIVLGRDARGAPVVIDLAEQPHVLVAGATGSGKSVGVNAMIVSLLLSRTPDELELVLIDPKMVELSPYEGIAHLRTPVVIDMAVAARSLAELTDEMDRRYKMFAGARCRHVGGFNARAGALGGKLPRIVVVVDELADVLASEGKAVEAPLARLLQKGRAAGIHLVLATQRPSADVVSGVIKANVSARVCYRVASAVDSRVVLDEGGAEQLAGKGDALVRIAGRDALARVQAPWVSERDVDAIAEDVRAPGARRDSSALGERARSA